jgi:shikimate kinase
MQENKTDITKIVLIGYMGSGKSTVGKALASELNLGFKDLDKLIEEEQGIPITELFRTQGEIYFRKVEAELLRSELLNKEEFVLASGGGTPCYAANMDFLNSRHEIRTFYLKHSRESLVERLMPEKDHRPVIAHLSSREELDDFLRKHLFERTFYYNQANHTIDCDGLTVDQIVNSIKEVLN